MHKPVLLKEVVANIRIPAGGVLLDGTLGGGGHSEAIANNAGGKITIVGIDQDSIALKKVENLLGPIAGKLILQKGNFRNLDKVLKDNGIGEVDGIILDLGFSSDQIADSGRGFSFMKDEPLIMTLDDSPTEDVLTARDVVNLWQRENLELIFRNYGEEKRARKIVDAIISGRAKKKIETSGELAKIIEGAIGRRGKIHPATKVFQAIRIAVNDELGALTEVLPKALSVLKKGSRLAIISFHSLEDRIVKRFFREKANQGQVILINKKPIIADEEEIVLNPRARSAKLRIIEKI